MKTFYHLPCEICQQPHAGQCTKCKKFFCETHLHYCGRDADTNDLLLLCPDDLKRKKAIVDCKDPNEISYASLVKLHTAIQSYLDALVGGETGREDAKQRIFEEALELFCGDKIWDTVNELVK